LIKFATVLLAEGELSPFDIGFKQNDFLLSAIARDKTETYRTPRDAFKSLLSSLPVGE
jgi:hypothetical protein